MPLRGFSVTLEFPSQALKVCSSIRDSRRFVPIQEYNSHDTKHGASCIWNISKAQSIRDDAWHQRGCQLNNSVCIHSVAYAFGDIVPCHVLTSSSSSNAAIRRIHFLLSTVPLVPTTKHSIRSLESCDESLNPFCLFLAYSIHAILTQIPSLELKCVAYKFVVPVLSKVTPLFCMKETGHHLDNTRRTYHSNVEQNFLETRS